MKIVLLLNPKARYFQRTRSEGPTALVRTAEEVTGGVHYVIGPVEDLAAAAASCERGDVVISAGGDGTIAALGRAVMSRGVELLPLPCGTMNLFSRDLGYPPDPLHALRCGLMGAVKEVDLGIAKGGGRTLAFLNNVVFGSYAAIASARENFRQASSVAESGAAIVEAASALMKATPSRFEVELDAALRCLSINTIVVANNRYSGHEGFSPRRAKLDAGVLAVYLASADGAGEFIARLKEFVDGTLEKSPDIALWTGRRCQVRRLDGAMECAVDGEPLDGVSKIEIELMPRALKVLAPVAVVGECRHAKATANAPLLTDWTASALTYP